MLSYAMLCCGVCAESPFLAHSVTQSLRRQYMTVHMTNTMYDTAWLW